MTHLLDIRFLGCSSLHEHEVNFCFTKTSFAVLLLPLARWLTLLHLPVHLLYLYNIRHLNSR